MLILLSFFFSVSKTLNALILEETNIGSQGIFFLLATALKTNQAKLLRYFNKNLNFSKSSYELLRISFTRSSRQ